MYLIPTKLNIMTTTIVFKTFMCLSFLLFTLNYFYPLMQKTALPNLVHNTSNGYLLYSYKDLDQQLCQRFMDLTGKSSVNISGNYECPSPSENFVSVASGARTGNLMWAYASVLAVSEQTGLRPYIPSCLKSSLEKYFENITVPDFKDVIHCPVRIDSFVSSVEEWKSNPQTLILPRYITKPREILPWIPNIRQKFTFKKRFTDAAQETLKSFTKKLPPQNYTFIGAHVRRTDYKGYLKSKYKLKYAPITFYHNAMKFFYEKYNHTLFIFVSDEPEWCERQFGKLKNVYVVNSKKNADSPALDLAIMAACNHTIYDYGSYGTWGAILAGGEAVCYDMIQNSKEGSLKYDKRWHLLS